MAIIDIGRGFLLTLYHTPLSVIYFELLLFSTVSNQFVLTLHVGEICWYFGWPQSFLRLDEEKNCDLEMHENEADLSADQINVQNCLLKAKA